MLWWFDLGNNDEKGDRVKAQRIMFEGGVVSPLVKEARNRMLSEKITDVPDTEKLLPVGERLKREARALAALIRIESDTLSNPPNLARLSDDVMF